MAALSFSTDDRNQVGSVSAAIMALSSTTAIVGKLWKLSCRIDFSQRRPRNSKTPTIQSPLRENSTIFSKKEKYSSLGREVTGNLRLFRPRTIAKQCYQWLQGRRQVINSSLFKKILFRARSAASFSHLSGSDGPDWSHSFEMRVCFFLCESCDKK